MGRSFHLGAWTVEPDQNTVSRDGQTVHLEPKPMEVLVRLATSAGETVSKDEIIRSVWPDTFVGDDALSGAIYELRKALQDDPHQPQIIQTIPKRGYRLIAPVEQIPDRISAPDSVNVLAVETAAPEAQRSWLSTQWKLAAAAAAVVVIAGSVPFISISRRRAPVGGTPTIQSLAILPLENLSGDPQQEYFADGMTESLITDLGRLTGLKSVIARGSVMRYKGTKRSPAEIARELNVDALITGAVMRSGDRVRITAQLIEPKSGEQLWTQHYERDLGDVLRLQNEVTSAIAGEIRVKLTASEQALLTSARSVNPGAYDAYLLARFHWYKSTPQALDQAMDYYKVALKRDPDYAPAYVGIGFVWFMRAHSRITPGGEGWAKAKAAAVKALEVDSTLPEAHGLLAGILAWHEWDWAAGEREYRRAIELNPNYADVRCFYSFFLHAMQRPQEATEQIERALELDPYNSFFHMALGMELVNEHRPDEALLPLQRAAKLQPDSLFVHMNLAVAYEQKGNHAQAYSELREYLKLLGADEAAQALERGYAEGDYQRAMRAVADAVSATSYRGHINSMDVALFYVAAGEEQRALDWLEKAYEEHSSMLPYLKVAWPLHPLRSDPRFQKILRDLNFPQ